MLPKQGNWVVGDSSRGCLALVAAQLVIFAACGRSMPESRWAGTYDACALADRDTTGMVRTTVDARIGLSGAGTTASMWVPEGAGEIEPQAVPSIWGFEPGNVSAEVTSVMYSVDSAWLSGPHSGGSPVLCADSIDGRPVLVSSHLSLRPGHEGWRIFARIDVDSATDIQFVGITYDTVDAELDKRSILRPLTTILIERN